MSAIETLNTPIFGRSGINTYLLDETVLTREGIYFAVLEGNFGRKLRKIVKIN